MPRMTEARLKELAYLADIPDEDWGNPDGVIKELIAEVRACWKELEAWCIPQAEIDATKPKVRLAKGKGRRA